MQTVSLSTSDRLLNIHQSVNLEQVVKLNKQMLNVQIKQNEKLNVLTHQLAESNQLNRQILENQISDLKTKEEQRFYKNLTFNCIEIIQIINSIESSIIKEYFILTYFDKLTSNLKTSKELLEEISDKQKINKHLEDLNKLKKEHSGSIEFSNSILGNLNDYITEYQNLDNKYTKDLNELSRNIYLIKIPSKGFLGTNKTSHFKALEYLQNCKLKYNHLIKEKESALNNHILSNALSNIKLEYPEFESFSDNINEVEISFQNKYAINFKLILAQKQKNDGMFKKALEIAILNKSVSASLLQRKLKIGYNRAGRLMDDFESAGLIKPFNGSKMRETTIESISELEDFLNAE